MRKLDMARTGTGSAKVFSLRSEETGYAEPNVKKRAYMIQVD